MLCDPSTRSPSQAIELRIDFEGPAEGGNPLAVLVGLGTLGGAVCAR
jgi:hypothetical protein